MGTKRKRMSYVARVRNDGGVVWTKIQKNGEPDPICTSCKLTEMCAIQRSVKAHEIRNRVTTPILECGAFVDVEL